MIAVVSLMMNGKGYRRISMFNYKMIYKSANADCTVTYRLLVEEDISVYHLIKLYILKNKKEFGRIGIQCKANDNEHIIEYKEGKILKEKINENERYFLEKHRKLQSYRNIR